MTSPRTDLLLGALGDEAAEVRAAAALGLAAHPSEAAVSALAGALSDEDNLVAVLAVNALVKLGGACVPQLIDAYDQAPARGRIQTARARNCDPERQTNDERHERWLGRFILGAGRARATGLNMVYLRPD
jgi:hypothetical protein